MPGAHAETSESVGGKIAHDSIDGAVCRLAPVVAGDPHPISPLPVNLGCCNHDLVPEDLGEGADFLAYVVEDLHFDVRADRIIRRSIR